MYKVESDFKYKGYRCMSLVDQIIELIVKENLK